MTATTDRAALYRGTLERPEDDVARLVFADWLEENGEAERAEFIRVQVEVDPWNHTWPPMTFERKDTLRRREHDLFDRFKTQWFDERAAIYYLPHEAEGAEGQYPGLTRAIVSKGFVSTVHTTLQSWVGEPCGCVNGHDYDSNGERTIPWCKTCSGTARTPGHGPRIVAEQPVETLALSDCKPDPGSGGIWFFAEEWIAMMPDAVAAEVDDLCWSKSELAEKFLGRSLLNWARREAGLPPVVRIVRAWRRYWGA